MVLIFLTIFDSTTVLRRAWQIGAITPRAFWDFAEYPPGPRGFHGRTFAASARRHRDGKFPSFFQGKGKSVSTCAVIPEIERSALACRIQRGFRQHVGSTSVVIWDVSSSRSARRVYRTASAGNTSIKILARVLFGCRVSGRFLEDVNELKHEGHQGHKGLNLLIASLSCFFAALPMSNVPTRFFHFPVLGSFLSEYKQYLPDLSFQTMIILRTLHSQFP